MFMRPKQQLGHSFFCVFACLFFVPISFNIQHTLLILFTSFVSLSHFILCFSMLKCLGKQSHIMSSTFPVAVLSTVLFFFCSVKAMKNWKQH